MYRTHTCGELRLQHLSQEVTLAGWVQRVRNLGGMTFIDLRDRSGIAQVTASPETCSEEVFAAADSVRSEYVLAVKGTVRLRPEGMTNDKLESGEIDVVATELEILNKAKTPPFYLTDDVDVDENIRLKYRYLDLRRPEMKNNIMLRHRVVKAMRDYLDEQGFLEIETPILQKSTPEGARDSLVPTRFQEGKFYALIKTEGADWTVNPYESNNWGLIGDYDPEYQYQFSETEYVVYKGKVYAPTMDVNADTLEEGYNIRVHDPRNGNVKKHMLRLAVYELHKLISPNNVSSARITDYETSILWLRDAARMKINPQIPRKLDDEHKPVTEYAIATFQRDYDPNKNPWQI